MIQKKLILVPFFACSLLLIIGALDHQPHFLPPVASASFVAQPHDAGLGNLTPRQILAQAAAALAPERNPWLRVKIWQKQVDDGVSFEAEGRLVRGPNQCARLETTVHSGPNPTALVTVSDGVALAHACRLPGQLTELTTRRFTTPAKKPMPPPQIDLVLNEHGCGGPYCLLKDLESILDDLQAVPGIWKDKRVIRLTGSVKENTKLSPAMQRAASPRVCALYLDAQTLWPHRVEWRSLRRPEEGFLFLQMEFRDPEINHPLSHEDCVREFTYQPE
jgi:hypothetical protein